MGDDSVDSGDKLLDVDERVVVHVSGSGALFNKWLGTAKIEQLDLIGGFVDHEVGGPDVAVHNTARQVELVDQVHQLLQPGKLQDARGGL